MTAYDTYLDPAPPANAQTRTTLTYTELLGIANDLIAFSERRTPGLARGLTFDALAAFVEAAPQRPHDIDQRTVTIARRHIDDAAAEGHQGALKAQARLKGGTIGESTRISFDDNLDFRDAVDNIIDYIDSRGMPGVMSHLKVRYTEYAEIVWKGERRGVEPRVIPFARARLVEGARNGNETAKALAREISCQGATVAP